MGLHTGSQTRKHWSSDGLRAALERRLAKLDLTATNAFRWVHGEGDLLPGVHADLYADTVVLRFDGDGARAFYEPFEPRLREAAEPLIPVRAVIDRASRPAGAQPDEREVLENGLRFGVDLEHGQKGGLFLDQRENRQRVSERREWQVDAKPLRIYGRVLCVRGGAGARRTDTVDLAKPAIEAARRNFERNGLSLGTRASTRPTPSLS